MRKGTFQLPLFGYLRIAKGLASAVLDRDELLPLFTSRENAVLFAQRLKLDCVLVEFVLPATLLCQSVITRRHRPG